MFKIQIQSNTGASYLQKWNSNRDNQKIGSAQINK